MLITRHTLSWTLSILLLITAQNFVSAADAHTPAAGTEERKLIMDVIRVPAERDLGQPVIFVVDHLRVSGKWAAARVTPQTPEGGKINYNKTKYREQIEFGAFDPIGEALLKRNSKGAWKLVKWRFGATDTALSLWIQKAGAPANLQ